MGLLDRTHPRRRTRAAATSRSDLTGAQLLKAASLAHAHAEQEFDRSPETREELEHAYLAAISQVMFHSGQRNDIDSIVELANSVGAKIILDAMQSVGVSEVDATALGITALAAGSHKGLLIPQGLGFLYTATDIDELSPTYLGTAGVANSRADLIAPSEPIQLRPDARRFEIGNFNLPAIHALGAALDLITTIGLPAINDHLLTLGDLLIERADAARIGLVGPRERAHRSHIYVLDLHHPSWPEYLTKAGVRLSPVRTGLRVSFGLYNTAEDADRLFDILAHGTRTLTPAA